MSDKLLKSDQISPIIVMIILKTTSATFKIYKLNLFSESQSLKCQTLNVAAVVVARITIDIITTINNVTHIMDIDTIINWYTVNRGFKPFKIAK